MSGLLFAAVLQHVVDRPCVVLPCRVVGGLLCSVQLTSRRIGVQEKGVSSRGGSGDTWCGECPATTTRTLLEPAIHT